MKTPVSVKNRHWCFVSYYMLNHPEVLQRLFNCLFLLRRALRLLDIFGLWLIVVLTLNDTAFLLYLCDIQAADLQAAMLQHIILNLLIGSFFLCISQIQLVQIQLHLDMLLGVEFGQKYYSLHMCRYYYWNTFHQPRYCHVNTIQQFYVVLLHFFFVV